MNRFIFTLAVCIGLTSCCGNRTEKSDIFKTEQTQSHELNDHVEILYFHGRQRCATCTTIEQNVREAIKTQFAAELESGAVVFKTIDISKSENEKIAEKYGVTWSSLIISEWKDGKETYENMTGFAFANARKNPETFKNEIANKVRTSLK